MKVKAIIPREGFNYCYFLNSYIVKLPSKYIYAHNLGLFYSLNFACLVCFFFFLTAFGDEKCSNLYLLTIRENFTRSAQA